MSAWSGLGLRIRSDKVLAERLNGIDDRREIIRHQPAFLVDRLTGVERGAERAQTIESRG